MTYKENHNELIQEELITYNEQKRQRFFFSRTLSAFTMVSMSIVFYFNLPGLWFLSPLLLALIDATRLILKLRVTTE
jgi:hypothetical protein